MCLVLQGASAQDPVSSRWITTAWEVAEVSSQTEVAVAWLVEGVQRSPSPVCDRAVTEARATRGRRTRSRTVSATSTEMTTTTHHRPSPTETAGLAAKRDVAAIRGQTAASLMGIEAAISSVAVITTFAGISSNTTGL